MDIKAYIGDNYRTVLDIMKTMETASIWDGEESDIFVLSVGVRNIGRMFAAHSTPKFRTHLLPIPFSIILNH